MIVKVRDLKTILDAKLSLRERGALITIILLKDSSSRLTLAKSRSEINFVKERDTIMGLHEKGFIEWSGYKKAKKALEEAALDPDVISVIDFINELTGKSFNASAKSTTAGIRRELKSHSVETLKLVFANRFKKWKDDATMSEYLTPHTVFRPTKFSKYLPEALASQKGASYVDASKLRLKKGQEITPDICKELNETDLIRVKILSYENGRKIGSGRIVEKLPKDLLKTFKTIDTDKTKYIYEGS